MRYWQFIKEFVSVLKLQKIVALILSSSLKLGYFLMEVISWIILVGGASAVGLAILLLQIIVPIAALIWLLWEWAPFGDKYEQRLFYTQEVEVPSADMRKIHIVDFSIDIDNQRVIQKIVSPLKPIKKQKREQNNLWVMTSNYFFPQEKKFTNQKTFDCVIKKRSSDKAEKCDKYFQEMEMFKKSELFSAYNELDETLIIPTNLLTQLDNCVVKSSDDWICKSKWYGSDLLSNNPSIGKRDGNWTFNPKINKEELYLWKGMMAIERFRCGNVCVLRTKTDKEERQKGLDLFMREMEKRRENR